MRPQTTAEALAVVADTSREKIERALDQIGDLPHLASEDDWVSAGLTRGQAKRIVAAFLLGSLPQQRVTEVRSPNDAYYAVVPLVEHDREKLCVIALDRAQRVIKIMDLFAGGQDRTTVDVHTIARRLLQCRATRAILVHNHPNGRMEPGDEDLMVTKIVRNALDTLNIDLVDHLVIGDGRFMSLKERALM